MVSGGPSSAFSFGLACGSDAAAFPAAWTHATSTATRVPTADALSEPEIKECRCITESSINSKKRIGFRPKALG